MGDAHLDFNPCCCFSLKTGTTVLAVFEIVYAIGYLVRYRYLEKAQRNFYEFFPQDIPKPLEYEFMHYMFRTGNYVLMIISSILLLISAYYLKNHFNWLALLCYIWLAIRAFLIVSFLIFCNALIASEQTHFVRLGYEILANVFLQFYFIAVVGMFIRDARVEFNNMRAIKPINIAKEDHEEYLRHDKIFNRFNNATSYHFLAPSYFLNSKVFPEHELMMDKSLLHYAIPKVKVVDVVPSQTSLLNEDSEMIEGFEKFPTDDSSMFLLKDAERLLEESDMSFMASQMSMPYNRQQEPSQTLPTETNTTATLNGLESTSVTTPLHNAAAAKFKGSMDKSDSKMSMVGTSSLVALIGAIGEQEDREKTERHSYNRGVIDIHTPPPRHSDEELLRYGLHSRSNSLEGDGHLAPRTSELELADAGNIYINKATPHVAEEPKP